MVIYRIRFDGEENIFMGHYVSNSGNLTDSPDDILITDSMFLAVTAAFYCNSQSKAHAYFVEEAEIAKSDKQVLDSALVKRREIFGKTLGGGAMDWHGQHGGGDLERKDLEEHRKKMPEFKDFWDAQEVILDCLDLCKIDEKFCKLS